MIACRFKLEAPDADATARLAAAIAGVCRPGDCLALSGELGAGKTTFARGFIRALAPGEGEITSPTFTLVQSYATAGRNQGTGMTIWHFDLYRIRRGEELDELGLDEALDSGVTLVEWPERAGSRLPMDRLVVRIDVADASGQRIFTLDAGGDWPARLTSAGLRPCG